MQKNKRIGDKKWVFDQNSKITQKERKFMNKDIINAYLPYIDPFATEDDLENVVEINNYEILFVFKNGDKIIFDTHRHDWKGLYPDKHKLSEKDCKRHFSSQLRRWMNRKCISQEELAKLLKTTQPMISRYVNGDALPGYYMMYKIADVLNLSVNDFFYERF